MMRSVAMRREVANVKLWHERKGRGCSVWYLGWGQEKHKGTPRCKLIRAPSDDSGEAVEELDSDAATDDGAEDPMRPASVPGERTPEPDLSEASPSEEFDQAALPSSTELSTVLGESLTSSHDKKYPASSSRLVKFTVTLTLAIPEGLEGGGKNLLEKSKSMKSLEALKPLKYYHIEWTLLPNGEVTKLDIVTFATAAKIYMGIDSQ
eukprot:g44725.t1